MSLVNNIVSLQLSIPYQFDPANQNLCWLNPASHHDLILCLGVQEMVPKGFSSLPHQLFQLYSHESQSATGRAMEVYRAQLPGNSFMPRLHMDHLLINT